MSASVAATVTPVEFINYIRNVDPDLEPQMEEAFIPKGSCRVATSAHFVFIVSHILRGMTPIEISSLLEKEKCTYVPPSQIRDYMLQHVPPSLMRAHLMYRFLQRESHKLDEVEILESLTKVQLARVMTRSDMPTGDVDDQESVRRDIDLCHKLATATLEAKIKTGRIKAAPKSLTLDVTSSTETQNIPAAKLNENIPAVDTQTAAASLRAIERLSAMIAASEESEKNIH